MKANDFVKKVGWNLAKEYADECPCSCNYLHEHGFYSISETWQLNEKHVLVSDLKRLVESHELVMDYYGLTRAKEYAESNYTAPEIKDALKQAIADVEACKEVSSESN